MKRLVSSVRALSRLVPTRWLGLSLLLATGCLNRTYALSAGHSAAGQQDFGKASHRQPFIVANLVAQASFSNVAPIEADGFWRVYSGGQRLEHCIGSPDQPGECRQAPLPRSVLWPNGLAIIDPVDLGNFVRVKAFLRADGYVYVVDSSGQRLRRASPDHGIWLRQTLLNRPPWHCRLDAEGMPMCASAPADGVSMFGPSYRMQTAVGLLTVGDEDVLWLNRYNRVARCTASADNPVPVCVDAEMLD